MVDLRYQNNWSTGQSWRTWNKYFCGTNYYALPFMLRHPKKIIESIYSNITSSNGRKPSGLESNSQPKPGIFVQGLGIEFPSFAFTTVSWSTAYDPPTVKVFSLVENLLVISPTAALFLNWSRWCTYDAFILSPLSPLRESLQYCN